MGLTRRTGRVRAAKPQMSEDPSNGGAAWERRLRAFELGPEFHKMKIKFDIFAERSTATAGQAAVA